MRGSARGLREEWLSHRGVSERCARLELPGTHRPVVSAAQRLLMAMMRLAPALVGLAAAYDSGCWTETQGMQNWGVNAGGCYGCLATGADLVAHCAALCVAVTSVTPLPASFSNRSSSSSLLIADVCKHSGNHRCENTAQREESSASGHMGSPPRPG